MSDSWYPGIKSFCLHWQQAPMLQQTLDTLEREFQSDNDACIDAAKAMVECACRVIIENLDDPASPLKPPEQNPDFGAWVSAAVRVLELDQIRDESFRKLISQYHKLTTTLGDLRNKAGSVSHGKDGFLLKLSTHHRRAALLAADAIITFLHEAYLEHEPELTRTREPYERFRKNNILIDNNVGVEAVEDEELAMVMVDIHLPNGDTIPLAIEPSRLLYEFDRDAYVAALIACAESIVAEEKPAHGKTDAT